MGELLNTWIMLHAVGFYPEITLFALAIYFLVRQWFNIKLRFTIYIPIIVSFIGEFIFVCPKNLQDFLINIIWAFVQAGLVTGIYSMADKYNLMDKLGGFIGTKVGKKTIAQKKGGLDG